MAREGGVNGIRNSDLTTVRGELGNANSLKRKSISYGPDSVEASARTDMEQESFAFLWTLRKYSAFCGSDEVKSPFFRGGAKSGHYWQLKMCPRKKYEELEYFSVHLTLASFGDGDNSPNRKIKARFQISILDAEGRPGKQAGTATMNACEFKKFSVWGYDKLMLSTDLISPSHRLVEDDSLKIHCRIWFEGELRHKISPGSAGPKSEQVKKQKKRLADDLGKLFKDSVLTDIGITTRKSTIMAHKAVLAARSQVFAVMITTMENDSTTLEVSDFEDEVIKGMLEYLYTGETDLKSGLATDLMKIADKFNIAGLKEDCEYAIAENLNIENATEILIMAQICNASRLKPRVINYINWNKKEVRKTASFQKAVKTHAKLFVDLYLSE